VLFGFDILPLTPFYRRDELVVLVPFFKAEHLCRGDGCDRLSVREALWHLKNATTAMAGLGWISEIRVFLGQAHLPGLFLPNTKGSQLIPIVARAIEVGELIALRKGDKAGKTRDETAEQRRLVREIEKQTRGRLNFSGRSYKLVADVDLAGIPGRSSYEVVGLDEALRVLDGLAKQSGTAGDLSALLAQASAKLTADWRPPFHPDGLILLRRIEARAASTKVDDGPALTPSQLRKLQEGWIVLEVVDDFERPWRGTVKIELPDASTREIAPDGEGSASADGFQPGQAVVTLLGLHKTSWEQG
jgi:hypothetical protein